MTCVENSGWILTCINIHFCTIFAYILNERILFVDYLKWMIGVKGKCDDYGGVYIMNYMHPYIFMLKIAGCS